MNYNYKKGMNRFMLRVEQMPHIAVFYDASGNHVAIDGDRAVNPVTFADDNVLTNIYQTMGFNQGLLNRKTPQLLQINKPNRGQFVHGGCIFNVNTQIEYQKQRYLAFFFLTEDNKQAWQQTIEMPAARPRA